MTDHVGCLSQTIQNTNQPLHSNCPIKKYRHLLGSMATQESGDFSWALWSDVVLCCCMVCMKLSPFLYLLSLLANKRYLLLFSLWPIRHDVLCATAQCRLDADMLGQPLVGSSELIRCRPTIHLLQENRMLFPVEHLGISLANHSE